jgi:hypothetical protein
VEARQKRWSSRGGKKKEGHRLVKAKKRKNQKKKKIDPIGVLDFRWELLFPFPPKYSYVC